MPFNLPTNFSIDLPNIDELANSAVGFAPNESLPRVSDDQRKEDERIYREQLNAAANLQDSIKVANKYVDAAVTATKLGKSLIQYQIGLQDIRTEKVNFQKSVVRTEIALTELSELHLKLGYQNDLLPQLEHEYRGKLAEAQSKAEFASRKALDHQRMVETRFPTIDVNAIAA